MKLRGINTLLLIVLMYVSTGSTFGQEKEIQSGIVYFFTKYIEWPANQQSGDFNIYVLGSDEITTHLKKLATVKKVGTRSINVKEVASLDQATGAHILILPNSKSGMFNSALQKAKAEDFLIVTNKNGLAARGAGINFVTRNNQPSYEINASTMLECGLKFSSKLSSLGSVLN